MGSVGEQPMPQVRGLERLDLAAVPQLLVTQSGKIPSPLTSRRLRTGGQSSVIGGMFLREGTSAVRASSGGGLAPGGPCGRAGRFDAEQTVTADGSRKETTRKPGMEAWQSKTKAGIGKEERRHARRKTLRR